MDKLTLEHLAPYLPYGLKFQESKKVYEICGAYISAGTNELKLNLSTGMRVVMGMNASWGKPILSPLSDLTKEIYHNGKSFVPIIELAKIATFSVGSSQWTVDLKNNRAVHETGSQFYFTSDRSFIYKESDKWKDFGVASAQLQLFQKLYEWHFDVFGLIAAGLAVDINTLKGASSE